MFTVHPQKSSTLYKAIGTYRTGYADCLLARAGWNQFHPAVDSKQSA